MVASHPLIELRQLRRHFGRTKAVEDISFSVQRGQVFGYIGPNGAGKTTSMRILATLDVPTLGDALIDGFSVVNDPDRVRTRLGFMPDYFGTAPNINVYEYLDFYARAYGLMGAERQRAAPRAELYQPRRPGPKADRRALQGHEAAALPGAHDHPRSGGPGARRAGGRTRSPGPDSAPRNDRRPGRRRQSGARQLAHPDRTGRNVRYGGHHRARAFARGRLGRRDSKRPPAAAGRAIARFGGRRPPGGLACRTKPPGGRRRRECRAARRAAGRRDDPRRHRDQRPRNQRRDGPFPARRQRGRRGRVAPALVLAGFRLAAFGSRVKSLEDVFMQVTEGRVQ